MDRFSPRAKASRNDTYRNNVMAPPPPASTISAALAHIDGVVAGCAGDVIIVGRTLEVHGSGLRTGLQSEFTNEAAAMEIFG